jgi:hypothetical protein
MSFITRPLPVVWPTGQRTLVDERRNSPFKASAEASWDLLEVELYRLAAVEPVVLEAGYQLHEIRQDGRPRAGARPVDPAVIVSFDSRLGPLRYGCDTFWQHNANLRAIALTLEHLRAVDRYGVTKRGEQYQGWAALPPSGEGDMSVDEAEALIRHLGDPLDELEVKEVLTRMVSLGNPESRPPRVE